mgnify:CR=1 FL=1
MARAPNAFSQNTEYSASRAPAFLPLKIVNAAIGMNEFATNIETHSRSTQDG